MKLRAKQVALYMDDETHKKALKQANRFKMSFSGFINFLVNTKEVETILKDKK